MRSKPSFLDEEAICTWLERSWSLRRAALEYLPVGGGSYHWAATEANGARYFVTVDDLDQKPWLGSSRDSVFELLRRCYGAALTLHDDASLDFVVAPIRDLSGSFLARIDSRFTLTLFPFVHGERVGQFDIPPTDCKAVARLLARLHGAYAEVGEVAPVRGFALPGRAGLEEALARRDERWSGGPLAERARRWLASNAGAIGDALAAYDDLAQTLTKSTQVITHGEPHGGNFMLTDAGLRLVDWDTVAFAPPERDLWLVASNSPQSVEEYQRIARRSVDQRAIDFYRIAWQLSDVAAFVGVLRSEHIISEDTEHALHALDHLTPSALR